MIFDVENSLWKSNFSTLRRAGKARHPRTLMANFVRPFEKLGCRRCRFRSYWLYVSRMPISNWIDPDSWASHGKNSSYFAPWNASRITEFEESRLLPMQHLLLPNQESVGNDETPSRRNDQIGRKFAKGFFSINCTTISLRWQAQG